MKRSLIALAVAGAFAAPVAMAADAGNTNAAGGITIYGAAGISWDLVKTGASTGDVTDKNISSNDTHVGLKGSEDLGSGNFAIWQMEEGVNINSAGSRYSRNSYLGLRGDSWGSVFAGIYDTPYKVATRDLDLFANTIADNRNLMGVGFDIRANNSVNYYSPVMSNFSIALATVAGAGTALSADVKGSETSLALMYHTDMIKGAFAYQTSTVGSVNSGSQGTGAPGNPGTPAISGNPNDKSTAWKLGGSYIQDAFLVNAVYERKTYTPSGASDITQSLFYLAGKFNVSASDAVKLAYTNAGNLSSLTDSGATQYSLGYDHNMSKRTTVYALYTKLSNKSNGANGLGFLEAATSTISGTANSSPSAFSIGIKHSF